MRIRWVTTRQDSAVTLHVRTKCDLHDGRKHVTVPCEAYQWRDMKEQRFTLIVLPEVALTTGVEHRVSIAIRLRAEWPKNRSSIPGRAEILLSTIPSSRLYIPTGKHTSLVGSKETGSWSKLVASMSWRVWRKITLFPSPPLPPRHNSA